MKFRLGVRLPQEETRVRAIGVVESRLFCFILPKASQGRLNCEVPTLGRKVIKGLGLTLATILLAASALFCFLVLDWRGSRDYLVQQEASPDGKFIPELHQIITSMHRRPDTLCVTLRDVSHPFGDKVYFRTYECSNLSAFRLQWESPNELKIDYGECDSGRWHTKDENAIRNNDAVWRDVKITYQDTKYVSTR